MNLAGAKEACGCSERGFSARIKKQLTGLDCFDLDIEIEVPAGITVLFGPSGAGKSTLLDCIAGVRAPDDGLVKVRKEERSYTLFDSEARVNLPLRARGIGYVFQNMALFPNMTAQENVEFGLNGLHGKEGRARAGEFLERFRVGHVAERKPHEISGGERQRVALARALGPEPQMLLLDEPLSALDAVTKAAILGDLRAWQDQRGVPVLYVTHSRREAGLAGERIVILQLGRIVAQGKTAELLEKFGALEN